MLVRRIECVKKYYFFMWRFGTGNYFKMSHIQMVGVGMWEVSATITNFNNKPSPIYLIVYHIQRQQDAQTITVSIFVGAEIVCMHIARMGILLFSFSLLASSGVWLHLALNQIPHTKNEYST